MSNLRHLCSTRVADTPAEKITNEGKALKRKNGKSFGVFIIDEAQQPAAAGGIRILWLLGKLRPDGQNDEQVLGKFWEKS